MVHQSQFTPERFAQGLSYAQFLAQAKSNREAFEQSYREFQLSPEDGQALATFNRKHGPLKVLAIGEDWCPDVVRGLPAMARIAEAGGMELRVFPRDQNLDLMDLYLKEGKFRSIPAFAFFDRHFRTIGHWNERPALAYQQMEQKRQELKQKGASEESSRAEMVQLMAQQRSLWQQETVRELRELLTRWVGT